MLLRIMAGEKEVVNEVFLVHLSSSLCSSYSAFSAGAVAVVVQPDSSSSPWAAAVLAAAAVAVVVDLADLAEAVLAVAEPVEAGKSNPLLQQTISIIPNPTPGVIQEFQYQ
jgi:acyl-CoA synthetase (AMP-forming)/AMP-acid ligase II